jgi:TetR/AcrR family transcriptional regulator, regulator of autoinduction and epiphytic fitness
VDGRTRRSLRTHEAIVDATIGLVEDGDLRPTAPRIAERAGVSVRSVFQHFDDLESLHAAVARRLVERVAVLVVPIECAMPLATRLEQLVRQRCLLLEAVTPIRRAADVHRHFSTEITDRLRDGQAFLRQEVAMTFAPELDAAGPRSGDLLDALDIALSWSTWEGLRAGLGRDRADAERVVRGLVAASLQVGANGAMMGMAAR